MFKRVKWDLTLLLFRPKFSFVGFGRRLNFWHNCCEQRTQWSQSWLHHYEWCFPIKLWHRNSPRLPWSSESSVFQWNVCVCWPQKQGWLELRNISRYFLSPKNGAKATKSETSKKLNFGLSQLLVGAVFHNPRKTIKFISFHITLR